MVVREHAVEGIEQVRSCLLERLRRRRKFDAGARYACGPFLWAYAYGQTGDHQTILGLVNGPAGRIIVLASGGVSVPGDSMVH